MPKDSPQLNSMSIDSDFLNRIDLKIMINDNEPGQLPSGTAFATARELSILEKLARHSLMSLNLFTTIPSYFSPAQVGEMLATALGLSNFESLFAKLFGISGVAGNIFLRNVSVYRFFEAYREGILKKDKTLIFAAINTAISDAAMATLLSNIIYDALSKGVIYFDFGGAVFGNFFVNYLSLITLDAHLCRDANTLKMYDQLDAFSFHLLGRSDDQVINILSKFLNLDIVDAMNINADPQNADDKERQKQKIKELLEKCESLSEDEFHERIKNYCETQGLWDGQSTGYRGMSGIARTSGIIAAVSLFKNNFNLYLNDMHLPLFAAAPLATLPIPPKGALYDRSWDNMFKHGLRFVDSFRNTIFLIQKDPKYLAFVVPMTALGMYVTLSGAGFYLVAKGFLDFMWNTVFNMDPISDGGFLYDASWLYKSIVTLVGVMTNTAVFCGAFSLLAGWIQNSFFEDENEASKLFAKMAKTLLATTIPDTTVMERAGNTYLGQAVCATAETVSSATYATASMVGSAASATASTVGSWISTAASYCIPSTLEGRQLFGGPISGYGSCGFFFNPNQTKKNPWVPSIARYLVPQC